MFRLLKEKKRRKIRNRNIPLFD